ncbi:MAG TPA: hypothetical protein VJ836_01575 [Candidatus Saccharimonadales bacterium]|nr:hypothetical protein [Candidatus Saccharimonadales bacterium]
MSLTDKQLRNTKLRKLHERLRQAVPGYLALCEAGSTTAGDSWVEGRSDRDIAIVISQPDAASTALVQTTLSDLGFNDTYLFLIIAQDIFLTTTSEQDLSMKFRGQTLFGPDLVAQKELPPRDFAASIVQKGLAGMERKLANRLLNSNFWSEDHLKDKLYPELKRLFMFLAARHYADTGVYPRSRQDVANVCDSSELQQVWSVLAAFDSATKAEVIAATEAALGWLKNYPRF